MFSATTIIERILADRASGECSMRAKQPEAGQLPLSEPHMHGVKRTCRKVRDGRMSNNNELTAALQKWLE